MKALMLFLLGMVGILCVASGQARLPGRGQARVSDFAAHEAVMDSLSQVHPRLRGRWLAERGLDDSYYTTYRKPESSGLRCVGRWPWGPSWELAGKDSLLFLGSGSGVRILSVTDSIHPRMLGQINARGLVSRLVVRDSLLFVACGNRGAQIYGIADPANPRELGSMDAVIGDLTTADTFCYVLGGDSLRIYNVANPGQPVWLSAMRDSGDILAFTNGHVFTGSQWSLNVVDVADPTQPRRVNTRSGNYFSLAARRNLLFQASYDPEFFAILDVSNPLAIGQVSRLTGVSARGMHVLEDYAYLAWGGLHIIDITNLNRPVQRGASHHYDNELAPYVFMPGTYAYLACRYGGLKVIDIRRDTEPLEVATHYVAGSAQDIAIQDTVALVTSWLAGLNTVSLSDPAQPRDLGWLGATTGTDQIAFGCAVDDSFGYVGWLPRPHFRTVSLYDPSQPEFVGQCGTFREAEAMVLRDSLLYVAQHYRFQVVNVARPREPRVVGVVGMGSHNWGVTLQDTLAYVGSWSGLVIVNVADPAAPRVVSTTGGTRTSTWGVAVQDTFVFVPSGYETLWVYSVADPAWPYPIAGAPLGQGNRGYDAVMAGDSLVFVGCLQGVVLVNISDKRNPVVVGRYPTPAWVRRVLYAPPFLYAACSDGGVAIFETTAVGIKEPQETCGEIENRLEVLPTLASDWVRVKSPFGHTRQGELLLVDVAGRPVRRMAITPGHTEYRLDIEKLNPGLYFVVARAENKLVKGRFVKP